MIAIQPERLMNARTGLEELLADALACLASPPQPNQSWLHELIPQRVPADDRGYWLLAALATQQRAIGAAEGWLDRPELPDDVRAVLVDLLSDLLATGSGAELTKDQLPPPSSLTPWADRSTSPNWPPRSSSVSPSSRSPVTPHPRRRHPCMTVDQPA